MTPCLRRYCGVAETPFHVIGVLLSDLVATVTYTLAVKIFCFVFLSQIIASPMSFFDTTPTGRVLNRFAKDQEEVDSVLPFNMDPFLQFSLLVTFTIIIISAVFPPMLAAVVIMGALFTLILL